MNKDQLSDVLEGCSQETRNRIFERLKDRDVRGLKFPHPYDLARACMRIENPEQLIAEEAAVEELDKMAFDAALDRLEQME